MNPLQPRIATLKASSLVRKRHRRFHLTPAIAAPSLLTWFEVIGYTVLLESQMSFPQHPAERNGKTEVVVQDRLFKALQQINSTIPSPGIIEAIYQVPQGSHCLIENNRRFHQLLTAGVDVTYEVNEETIHNKIWLIDPSNLGHNDWLVIHPLTVIEGNYTHTVDVIVFINGLPLAVIIWMQHGDEKTTLKQAYQRLQVYKQQIPTLFIYNAFLIIACGSRARVGTLTSDWQDFLPWHTIDGEDFPAQGETELEVLIQGIFDKRRFLELIQHFIVFEHNKGNLRKNLLRYPFCTRQNPKIQSRF